MQNLSVMLFYFFINEKKMNNLCSEQRIIYVEKIVNNFLNNAEQKIILNRMLEIVNAENSDKFL